jgi:hemin uptake protein HemP
MPHVGVMSFQSAPAKQAPTPNGPTYAARDLTEGSNQAQIVLDDQTYTLRITRAGKLILTK